ncbi:DUF1804 family protein [Pseudoalteromonas sp. SMS1]|uniref:DUF1804 family protein n=1 Tax=Pseudoalteromonas TaxID=53246 RepID=UPI0007B08A1F|nr:MULTISPECIES: DUF1804 family protein [Pseudoalteromonas]KZN30088.1 hypothetical protein N480_03845 [Pseudoalteromonas luteoviolacea S2607]KZW99479.1 DNA-binding protein [Pseudoalteromonas luteoviolacea]MCF2855945.1 DUF1804 family protein [Pseudoalteromonas sp. SMS1]
MAHPEDKKNAVRHSYVSELLALSVAAIKHTVADSTARRWKSEAKAAGDDWDLARAAARKATGPAGEFTQDFIEEFTIQTNATFELIKQDEGLSIDGRIKALNQLSDTYTKIMKLSGGNKSIEKRAVAADVLKKLASFVSKYHPDYAQQLVEILTAFGPQLSSMLDD